MSTQVRPSNGREQGFALVIVLLLMAVMTGLASGFALHGRVEAAMAANEVTYAGARAAAEAGLNRAAEAVVHNNTINLLAGPDGLVDADNPTATVNADNGSLASLLTGTSPYALGTDGQYTYTIQILDDDDPSLYQTTLSPEQLVAMMEDGSAYTNTNDRLILRATGFGPNNTVVRVSRVLESFDNTTPSTTTAPTVSNPAILVNGNLTVTGNAGISGTEGNVHANGNLVVDGSATITGDTTASGTFNPGSWHPTDPTSTFGGNMPSVNVPNVNAVDYLSTATHKLVVVAGVAKVQTLDNPATVANEAASCNAPCGAWSYASGTWTANNSRPANGTYYVEGNVSITGHLGTNGSNPVLPMTLIATGDIHVAGTPKLEPYNSSTHRQFVTDGDLDILGNVDLDTGIFTVEGQSLARGQLRLQGNAEIRGQIIAQDQPVGTLLDANTISGNARITYNGLVGAISTPGTFIPGVTTYVNNIRGWLESQ